jgi:hypothetical protein
MDDQVLIAADQTYWYQDWKKEELLGPLPPPPDFLEPIEAVRARIAKVIGKVTVAESACLAPCYRPSSERRRNETRKETCLSIFNVLLVLVPGMYGRKYSGCQCC